MYERPGRLSDGLPAPYANEQVGGPAHAAAGTGGCGLTGFFRAALAAPAWKWRGCCAVGARGAVCCCAATLAPSGRLGSTVPLVRVTRPCVVVHVLTPDTQVSLHVLFFTLTSLPSLSLSSHIHTDTHTHIHTHTHSHIFTHAHTCIYTHTPPPIPRPRATPTAAPTPQTCP
jgi:hypothetical protein